MPDISRERALVVEEARTWLRTPYHHMGRIKGAGVDCATLLAECYARARLIPSFEIPFYPLDWHLHRDAERYLGFVLDHAVEIGVAQARRESSGAPSCEATSSLLPAPGDVALWQFGRCFAHGAIVVDWPLVVHAHAGRGCVLEDVSKASWLMQLGRGRGKRPLKFFTLKRWAAPILAKEIA